MDLKDMSRSLPGQGGVGQAIADALHGGCCGPGRSDTDVVLIGAAKKPVL